MKSSIIKLFALVLMITFSGIDAFAQPNFGVLASVGGSNISDYDEGKMKIPAFNIGGFANLALSDNVDVEGQLSFAARGNSYEEKTAGVPPFIPATEIDGNINLSYIQIAAIAHYFTEVISAGGGIYAGIPASAKTKADVTTAGTTVEIDEDLDDPTVDVGVQLEALYNISEMFGIGLVFQQGLTDIVKETGDDSPKNSFIGVTAKFRLTDN